MNKQTIKSVKVSATGVQFGDCWLSHEQITGYSADLLNAGSAGLIGNQYVAWLSAEDPAPVFDEDKERAIFNSLKFTGSSAYRKKNGEYKDFMDEEQWTGWLACAKSRAGIQP